MVMHQAELIDKLINIEDPTEQRQFLEERRVLLGPAVVQGMKEKADHTLRNETPKALKIAESALVVSELLDDRSCYALSLRAKAQALHFLGRLEESLAEYDEASGLYAQQSEEVESGRTLIGKIDALLHLGRHDEALRTADNCRKLFSAHQEPLLEAKVMMNQGNIHHRLDRYGEALTEYRAARKVFEAHREPLLVALADTNLGNSYSSTTQFRQAQQAYQRAAKVYKQSGMKAALAMNESNLGFLFFLKGSYNQALVKLNSARHIFEEMGIAGNIATVDLDTAEVYSALNMKTKALAVYDSALNTFRSVGSTSGVAKALAGKGAVHVQSRESELARAELAEAQRYFEDEDNQVFLGLVELHQAILMQHEQAHEEAVELAERARARFLNENLPAKTAYTQLVEGESLKELGRESEAVAGFKSALAAGQAMGLPWLVYESHAALGQTYLMSKPNEARRHYVKAVEAVERTRKSLRPEELKAAFVQNKQSVYADLVSLFLAEGSEKGVEEAFHYVERSKSQALLDMLEGQIELRATRRLKTLREELNSYYNMIDRYETREGQRTLSMIHGMHNRIQEREEEYMELVRDLQLQSGEVASLHHPIAVNATQLRHLVGADTALIEYFTVGDEIGAFVMVEGEPLHAYHNLTTCSRIETLSRKLRFQLLKVGFGGRHLAGLEKQLLQGSRLYLRELYQELLEPLETHLRSRLLIVPDGVLHYIPFHALDDGERYLIDQHEVTYAPSASVLKFCWDKATSPVRKPLVVGVADDTIPYAVEEAEGVASLFPDATLLVGKEATHQRIQSLAATHDMLHLASHAVFRNDNPTFSGIPLKDGWLTLHDIYNLELKANALVTLSACDTGVSSVSPGDELVGLTRGLFYAGTPSLVVSLWEVNDETTGKLMRSFYQGLQAGKQKIEALREAQLQVREEHPHPYYWAPFILSGKSE